MTHEEFYKALESYKARLAAQDAKGSTGSTGKLYEVLLRQDLAGCLNAKDVACRPRLMNDATANGLNVEVKTGLGAVAYSSEGAFTKEDLDREDLVMEGVDIVCYAPVPAWLDEETWGGAFWVFTREQFIEMLTATGSKGLKSSLTVSKGGKQINIQPWSSYSKATGKVCHKREDKMWTYIDEHSIPTYEEWKEARGV